MVTVESEPLIEHLRKGPSQPWEHSEGNSAVWLEGVWLEGLRLSDLIEGLSAPEEGSLVEGPSLVKLPPLNLESSVKGEQPFSLLL